MFATLLEIVLSGIASTWAERRPPREAPTSERAVSLAHPPRARTVGWLGLIFAAAVAAALVFTEREPLADLLFASPVLVLFLWGAFALRRRIELREDGIHDRGMLRRRTIRWSDVASVRRGEVLMTRVHVIGRDGRAITFSKDLVGTEHLRPFCERSLAPEQYDAALQKLGL